MITPEQQSEVHNNIILEIKNRAKENIVSDLYGLSSDINIPNIGNVLKDNFSIIFDANEIFNLIEFSKENGFDLDKISDDKASIAKMFIELVEFNATK